MKYGALYADPHWFANGYRLREGASTYESQDKPGRMGEGD
jgi:hypothetical protein